MTASQPPPDDGPDGRTMNDGASARASWRARLSPLRRVFPPPRALRLAAHPLRALLEAWLIALGIALGLAPLIGRVTPATLGNGTLMLCAASGLWMVWRRRIPTGGLWRQALAEAATGAALSAALLALQEPLRLLGVRRIWSESQWGLGTGTLWLAATGAGYLLARAALRIWLAWDALRRRRLIWALTHAHLMVVVLAGALGSLLIFLASPYALGALTQPVKDGAWVDVASEFLLRLFPTLAIMVLFVIVGLAVVLPPSALFSYLVARRTTRRLEALAEAAQAFRAGDYAARVAVSGEDEVGRLQGDFNAMAEELQRTLADLRVERNTVARLLQDRREMIAGVSHELRTPVATVRAILESRLASLGGPQPGDAPDGATTNGPSLVVAPSGASSPDLVHDLRVMDQEMARLQRLIDDLFLLARADAGRLQIDCCPTDAAAVARRAVDALAPLAWQAGRVEVVADLPEGLPPARADAERLGQVLANLLRNAIRHTEPGGIVAVALCAEPGALCLQVRDTGPGIPPEELPHIWERFYRGAEDRALARDGAGLGLALVKELAEAMGGAVSVESEVGRGSCFTVRLLAAM